MSLFKSKLWWSNQKVKTDENANSFINNNSVKVERFSSLSDSDCILLGDGKLLSVYKPIELSETSDVILEKLLDSEILHVETGKFTSDTDDRQILILHTTSYLVFNLQRTEGQSTVGDQYDLELKTSHTLTKKAYSVTCGPFGRKNRDLVCVQNIDGTLSIFDQDMFVFSCVIDDVIIPCPVAYIASADTFVVCKSTWIMEIYSYSQLRDLSEDSRQNKKVVPQWLFNPGEELYSVQIVQTSNNFSSIIALGERFLYCFQDNGLMKFAKKFDFIPVCSYAYLIGWYYEPTARMLIMVASDDAKLHIYESTTLLWSCDIIEGAISISRCFLRTLPGGIVVLSNNGIVSISYIGTEPDLNPSGPAVVSDAIDHEVIQKELDAADDLLRSIMSKDGHENEEFHKPFTIKINIGDPTFTRKHNIPNKEDQDIMSCQVTITMAFDQPEKIQAVLLTYTCRPPFLSSDTSICLNSVGSNESIESKVYLVNTEDISDPSIHLILTIVNVNGKLEVISKRELLPLGLYSKCVDENVTDGMQLKIESFGKGADLGELFHDLIEYNGSKLETVTISNPNNEKMVSITKSNTQYIVKSEDYLEMLPVLEFLVQKLMERESKKIGIIFDKNFETGLIHKFLKCIESHAKERVTMREFEADLSILHKQFTLIQKKLLIQYSSSPPGDCESLEFLMKDTYDRITECAQHMISCKDLLVINGNIVAGMGRLITLILKLSSHEDKSKVNLAEEMLSPDSLYEDNQDWEESVTQALSYVTSIIFKKSEKDVEKLAPVTEQGVLSHINLKRFLRQIRIVLDKMFSEIHGVNKTENEQITRIEELVDVI